MRQYAGNVNTEDLLNGILKDILAYCYEYGCWPDQAASDYDQPLDFLGDDLDGIKDAAYEILQGLADQAFNERL